MQIIKLDALDGKGEIEAAVPDALAADRLALYMRDSRDAIDVTAPTWEETGPETDPKSRLLATIKINGLNMHLEAWQIHSDSTNQDAKWMELNDKLGTLQNMMDCDFQTTKIGWRDYVLVCTPYGK